MAAKSGSMVLIGRSGRTYNLGVYFPDAVATYLGFAATGTPASTSPTDWRAPEDCTIAKVYGEAAGPTATYFTFLANGVPIPGGVVSHATILSGLSNTPNFNIPIKAGDFLGGLQS